MLNRLRGWIHWRRLQQDLEAELETHRAMRQEQLERSGVPAAEAAAASRRALGNVTLAREDARAVWLWPWLESFGQDVRYALRMVGRSPGFALSVIVVTALGIGATTSIVTLLDALVLRSLPVRDPSRLAYLDRPSFSYPIFRQVQSRGAAIFEGLFAWNMERMNVQWRAEVEPMEVLFAGGAFHSTLGVRAEAGRLLGADDDQLGGGPDGLVAVISHACWQRRFGGDPSVVGRTIRIDRRPFTIVGVTQSGFYGVAAGLAPEITVPLLSLEPADALEATTRSWLHVMGRLRDGVSLEDANNALRAFWPLVLEATTNPAMPADRRAMYLGRQTSLESGRAGFSRVRNQFAEPLWLLLALVGLLLLIAGAGTTNLLLARASARRRELAVRMAIGAGRRRVIRQLLTETTVWTSLGAALGLLLAIWGGGALVGLMTTSEETLTLDPAPTPRILLFTFALTFVIAAACTAGPAMWITRMETGASLKGVPWLEGGRVRRWTLNSGLVVAQVAIAIVLVAGAALFVRSLQRVLSQDAGFERDNLLVIATDPVFAGYEGARLTTYYDQLLERLTALPGVDAASLSLYPPVSNEMGSWTQSIGVGGAPAALSEGRFVHFTAVSPGYFRTLGISLLHGRDFTRADDPSSARVVIINESLARAYFGSGSPLGQRITVGRSESRRDLTIVGIVRDAKYQRLQEPTRRIAYLPHRQFAEVGDDANLFGEVRASRGLSTLGDSVRQAVRALDPAVPVRLETLTDRIRESVVTERVLAILAFTLGVTALALACTSLFGLLAYAVTRRTREIGLRMALGAERREVIGMVLRDCLTIASVGILAGLCASLALGRFARTLLFQIGASDPVSLVSACAIMLAVTIAAGWIPARRAARIEPVVALRQD